MKYEKTPIILLWDIGDSWSFRGEWCILETKFLIFNFLNYFLTNKLGLCNNLHEGPILIG